MCARPRFVALAFAVLALCATQPGTAHAQSGTLWRPDDRVLISDFSIVLSLARDGDVIYGATPNGLLIHDAVRGAFRPALTLEDGYPVFDRPSAVAYIQSDFRLLLGTARGSLFSLATSSTRFEPITQLPGPIVRLTAPRGALDAFAETPAGWFRLRSGSFFPERVERPPVDPSPVADDPYLRSMLGSASSIIGRIPAELTSLETGRIPGRFYAGTMGNGIVALDTRTLETARLPYGINTRGVNTIAQWGGRIWFGGDRVAQNGSLVSARTDLTDFVDYQPRSGAPIAAVRAIGALGETLWIGTEEGLYSLSANGRWADHTLLSDAGVTALHTAKGALFIGTERGAWVMRDATDDTRTTADPVLTGTTVHAFATGSDTLWIATSAGLAALPLHGTQTQPVLLRGGGSPIGPIAGAVQAWDTLYVATPDGLYRRGAGGWGVFDPVPASVLAGLTRIHHADGQLWLAGNRGAAVMRAPGAAWTYYSTPEDIPEGPVRDLLPGPDHVWIATPAGAMRMADRN